LRNVVVGISLLKNITLCSVYIPSILGIDGRRDRDRMVVGFTTACVISCYHH